jgi:predicted nuclease with TOPRIM domain
MSSTAVNSLGITKNVSRVQPRMQAVVPNHQQQHITNYNNIKSVTDLTSQMNNLVDVVNQMGLKFTTLETAVTILTSRIDNVELKMAMLEPKVANHEIMLSDITKETKQISLSAKHQALLINAKQNSLA